MKRAGLDDRTVELNRLAVRLAQEARANVPSDKPVLIAGSMSTFIPKGDPTVIPTYEAAFADYQEQAGILAEAGVDLMLLEMLIRTVDVRAAMEAAVATGLPTWVGLSVRRDGKEVYVGLRDGREVYLGLRTKRGNERLAEAVDIAASAGASAMFVMHSPIEDATAGLRELRRLTSLPVGAYPHVVGDETISPEKYLEHAREWVEMGAQIVGGCCFTTPDHIARLSKSLVDRPPI